MEWKYIGKGTNKEPEFYRLQSGIAWDISSASMQVLINNQANN